MATGITLGVPTVESSGAGGGKRHGALGDAGGAAHGFAGLVEMLGTAGVPARDVVRSRAATPARDPRAVDVGRGSGHSRPTPVEARLSFDTSTPGGQSFEQGARVSAADSALEPGAGSGLANPDDEISTHAGVVEPAQVTPAVPVPVVPVAQQWPLTPDVPTGTAGVEGNGQRGHLGPVARVLPASSLSAPTVTDGEPLQSAGSAGALSSESSPGLPMRSGMAAAEEPPLNAGPSRVSDRAADSARAHRPEPREVAGRPGTDEARAAAVAELQLALAQRPVATRAPIEAESSANESAQASEPQTPRGRGNDTPVPVQSGLGSGIPTFAPTPGDASGREQGNGRQDSGRDPLAARGQSHRQGGPGAAAFSLTAEPVALRDLSSVGAHSTAPPTQTPGRDAAPDLPQQVVRAVHMQWRQGIGEARLQLHPEHLGQLTVSLRVEGGLVTAVLRTESRLALERIEANQQELRTALEQQGLRLDRLVVAVDPDARERRQPPASPWLVRRHRRPTGGQPLFDLGDVASG